MLPFCVSLQAKQGDGDQHEDPLSERYGLPSTIVALVSIYNTADLVSQPRSSLKRGLAEGPRRTPVPEGGKAKEAVSWAPAR